MKAQNVDYVNIMLRLLITVSGFPVLIPKEYKDRHGGVY